MTTPTDEANLELGIMKQFTFSSELQVSIICTALARGTVALGEKVCLCDLIYHTRSLIFGVSRCNIYVIVLRKRAHNAASIKLSYRPK